MSPRSVQQLSATGIDGDKVKSAQGEKLVKIEDWMADLASGRISYAVPSFGGFLGLGDKLFANPMEALTHDPEDKAFVLNASKEKLEKAPGFDKDNRPGGVAGLAIAVVFALGGRAPRI